jgi:NADH dehydrogenase
VEIGGLRLTRFLAWILWWLAHVYFLIGSRNRFSVALNWAWSYPNFQRAARLITGPAASPPGAIAAASAAVARAVRDAA